MSEYFSNGVVPSRPSFWGLGNNYVAVGQGQTAPSFWGLGSVTYVANSQFSATFNTSLTVAEQTAIKDYVQSRNLQVMSWPSATNPVHIVKLKATSPMSKEQVASVIGAGLTSRGHGANVLVVPLYDAAIVGGIPGDRSQTADQLAACTQLGGRCWDTTKPLPAGHKTCTGKCGGGNNIRCAVSNSVTCPSSGGGGGARPPAVTPGGGGGAALPDPDVTQAGMISGMSTPNKIVLALGAAVLASGLGVYLYKKHKAKTEAVAVKAANRRRNRRRNSTWSW